MRVRIFEEEGKWSIPYIIYSGEKFIEKFGWFFVGSGEKRIRAVNINKWDKISPTYARLRLFSSNFQTYCCKKFIKFIDTKGVNIL